MNRPFAIATACAIEKLESTVTTVLDVSESHPWSRRSLTIVFLSMRSLSSPLRIISTMSGASGSTFMNILLWRLGDLLSRYAEAGAADRAAWLDRVMSLGDAEPADLSRLHGQLLAAAWIEQNTGSTAVLRRGSVPACYRVTTAGLRAWKQARAAFEAGEKRECVL